MVRRSEIAVVGRGMIGAAAARHLAAAGHAVTLIGPPEPTSYDEPNALFSSHYDEGRVTRITAFDEPWGRWARASVDRYAAIADRSGIDFHDPVELVVMADDVEQALGAAVQNGADVAELEPAELFDRTGIRCDQPQKRVLWEGPPAGLINPRRLVEAQTTCARLLGASVLDATVTQLDETGSEVVLHTADGAVEADRVLLCTGAYASALLGETHPVERRLRTIVLAELDDGPDLPTMIIDDPPHRALEEAYWVPPIPYPNGRRLLKIGGDSIPKQTADSPADIAAWFRAGGSRQEADALRELLVSLLPERRILWSEHKPCVVTYTPSGVPYIERATDRVGVAFGGCGAAAKSSDEIGRLAAERITT